MVYKYFVQCKLKSLLLICSRITYTSKAQKILLCCLLKTSTMFNHGCSQDFSKGGEGGSHWVIQRVLTRLSPEYCRLFAYKGGRGGHGHPRTLLATPLPSTIKHMSKKSQSVMYREHSGREKPFSDCTCMLQEKKAHHVQLETLNLLVPRATIIN